MKTMACEIGSGTPVGVKAKPLGGGPAHRYSIDALAHME
ncbi:hypothetical protein SAMN06265784_102564 [Paraburkholderia susongensis]|uniref:Uncharacterized protein n=1 Tax=Paraburkholderia susongensis TaxID=1515439 RepID=A0A1X7JFL0_9BURK|nr:hypothetical protein SAMN06265784_102564 [Paraburkholderia susongensis]